jgi:hypothetical protein
MDLNAVTKVFNEELGQIEAQLSILLSHIEGRYESEIAKLKGARGFFRRIFK